MRLRFYSWRLHAAVRRPLSLPGRPVIPSPASASHSSASRLPPVVVIVANHDNPSSIILDTDSTALASRVSRSKADTTEIVINEQTILNAYQTVKEKMQQRIGQL